MLLFGFYYAVINHGECRVLETQAKALIEIYSNDLNNDLLIELNHIVPVSYTHLDVYKRQLSVCTFIRNDINILLIVYRIFVRS